MSKRMTRFVLCLALVATVGCTDIHGKDVVKFHEGDADKSIAAPQTAHYVLACRAVNIDGVGAITLERHISAGTPLGFHRIDGGKLVAFASNEKFELGPMPVTVQYYAWRLNPKHDPKRDFARVTRSTARIAGIIAGAAVVGGVEILSTPLSQEYDDYEDAYWREQLRKKRDGK